MPLEDPTGLVNSSPLTTNLVGGEGEKPGENLNFVEALAFHSAGTFLGTLANKTLPLAFARNATSDQPGFDPYKYATDDYFQEKPWMVKPFMDGSMDDVHNNDYLLAVEMVAEKDYRREQALGNVSWYVNYPTMFLSQVPELAITGVAGKAVGLGPYVDQVARWAGNGSLYAKMAKGAVAGAVSNTLYDQSMAAVDPTRAMFDENDIQNDVALGAALGGVAIPTILHSLGYAGRKAADGLNTTRLRRLQVKAAEFAVSPDAKSATDAVAEQVGDLEKLAKVNTPTVTPEVASVDVAGSPVPPPTINNDVRSLFPDEVAGDGRVHKWVIDSPETRPLVEKLKAQYGDQIEFHEHPQQGIYDAKLRAEMLLGLSAKNTPESIGPVADRVLKLFNAPFKSTRITQNPLAMHASALMYDILDLTDKPAWMNDPFSGRTSNTPAELLRMGMDGYHRKFQVDVGRIMADAQRAGGFDYRTIDGRNVSFRSKSRDRNAFDVAVRDAVDRVNAIARGEDVPPASVPEPVKKAMEAYKALRETQHKYGIESGLLPETSPDAIFLSHIWDTEKVRVNKDAFVSDLAQAAKNERFRKKRQAGDKEYVDPDIVSYERPARDLVPDLNGKDKLPDGRAARRKGIDDNDRLSITTAAEVQGGYDKLTTDDLRKIDPDLPNRYAEEAELYDVARSQNTYDTLTAPSGQHGVNDALQLPDTFKKRSIDVSSIEMRKWLRDGVFDQADAAAFRTHGKIAATLAIKRNADFWSPFVKEYTGKNLAESNYDPHLVADAVERQLDDAANTTMKAGDAKLSDEYRKFKDMSTKAVRDHLNKMMNGSAAPSSNASVAWKFAGRQIQRLTTMAMQGSSLVTNILDITAPSALHMMGEGGGKLQSQWLKGLAKSAPLRRDIENMYAVAQDMAHQMEQVEIGDIQHAIEREPFGPGLKGKVMTSVDKGTAWLSSRFYRHNGMRWWSHNGRVAAANGTYDFVAKASQALVKADDMIAAGTSREAALDAVGMSDADARLLANLGFNVKRARRLLDKIDKHGLDWQGNRIDRNHDGQINLEAHAWADSDRDLYDALVGAVNSNSLNIVLEPKQGYRMMVNDYSTTMKLINTMSSFTMAYGAQWMPLLLRRTGAEKAMWLAQALALGAVVDALQAHLSGRRSLEQTAERWEKNPAGMVYGAIDRSGMLGWMSRVTGPLESAGIGPGAMLGNDQLNSMYGRKGRSLVDSAAGPAFQHLRNVSDFFQGNLKSLLEGGTYDPAAMRSGFKALPYNNWLGIRAVNRASEAAGYGTLVGPEPQR